MDQHEKINYVELPARDLEKAKAFFSQVFGWQFTDYGPDYAAFANAGLDGGFYRADLASSSEAGAALVVFYSRDLEQTLSRITASGGRIIKPIFAFPGGRRFHFADPNDNEFAVWSDLGLGVQS